MQERGGGWGGEGGRVQSDPPTHLPRTRRSVPAPSRAPSYNSPGLRNPPGVPRGTKALRWGGGGVRGGPNPGSNRTPYLCERATIPSAEQCGQRWLPTNQVQVSSCWRSRDPDPKSSQQQRHAFSLGTRAIPVSVVTRPPLAGHPNFRPPGIPPYAPELPVISPACSRGIAVSALR